MTLDSGHCSEAIAPSIFCLLFDTVKSHKTRSIYHCQSQTENKWLKERTNLITHIRVGVQALSSYFLGSLVKQMGICMFHLIHDQEEKRACNISRYFCNQGIYSNFRKFLDNENISSLWRIQFFQLFYPLHESINYVFHLDFYWLK